MGNPVWNGPHPLPFWHSGKELMRSRGKVSILQDATELLHIPTFYQCIPVKLHWTFPEAPLEVNVALGNIHGKLTGMLLAIPMWFGILWICRFFISKWLSGNMCALKVHLEVSILQCVNLWDVIHITPYCCGSRISLIKRKLTGFNHWNSLWV